MSIGDVRPSQLIYTYGVGAVLDLPKTSGIVMGLDDWDVRFCSEIVEDRLLQAIQRRMGRPIRRLLLPPLAEDDADPTASPAGVPIAAFPRWLRCPHCDLLATIDSGMFTLHHNRYRPEQTGYIHKACQKSKQPSAAIAVRFLLACRNGHLTDFPWINYVHNGAVPCKPSILTMREFGASGDASDIIVKCNSPNCNKERRMGDAFDSDRFSISCRGHHPHLRQVETSECTAEAKTILLGASNSWFPSVMSSITIPSEVDRLPGLVEDNWIHLKNVPSLEVLRYLLTTLTDLLVFSEFQPEQVWQAVEAKRQGTQRNGQQSTDLKVAEWQVFMQGAAVRQTPDYRVSEVSSPIGFEDCFNGTLLLERIREVRALICFTRIESNGEFADTEQQGDLRQTRLSRGALDWLPASEVRGEGLFLRFNEGKLQEWERESHTVARGNEFLKSHAAWRAHRHLVPANDGFPGMRYVFLHSFSHALMRQIALECGYTAASIRERIYSRLPSEQHGPMAGVLIYTAASDSEGTLGGLVHLGQPHIMGRLIRQALESMRICGSDPLCADREIPTDGRSVHGASCHACLFAPETSCEKGNRYLDRSTLISTFAEKGLEFFRRDR